MVVPKVHFVQPNSVTGTGRHVELGYSRNTARDTSLKKLFVVKYISHEYICQVAPLSSSGDAGPGSRQ